MKSYHKDGYDPTLMKKGNKYKVASTDKDVSYAEKNGWEYAQNELTPQDREHIRSARDERKKAKINKDEETKQKQIAQNKKEADERNRKTSKQVDHKQVLKGMASSGKYKNTVELQDAYEEYIAKLPPSQRNKLLQGIGSKGADRIQAAANDFAVNRNGKNLPIPKRSWSEIDKHQKQQKEKINKILSASKKGVGKENSKTSKAEYYAELDSLYSKYSNKYSPDPKSWVKYGEAGVQAYNEYSYVVSKIEPNTTKRAKYFKDRRQF